MSSSLFSTVLPRTHAITLCSAIPQSACSRCLSPRGIQRRVKPMARSDEPVDFMINLEPSRSDVAILMEERNAGEIRSQLETKRLEDVAASYNLLRQEGSEVYEFAQLGQRLFGSLFADAHQRKIFVRASDAAEREERPLRILIKLPHDSP